MRTTIKQQMAAVRFAMKRRKKFIAIKNESTRISFKLGHTDKKVFYRYHDDKNWLALNDAYSTLAAIALVESMGFDEMLSVKNISKRIRDTYPKSNTIS